MIFCHVPVDVSCRRTVQESLKLERASEFDFPSHLIQYDGPVDPSKTMGCLTPEGWLEVYKHAMQYAPPQKRRKLNLLDIGAADGGVAAVLQYGQIEVVGVKEVPDIQVVGVESVHTHAWRHAHTHTHTRTRTHARGNEQVQARCDDMQETFKDLEGAYAVEGDFLDLTKLPIEGINAAICVDAKIENYQKIFHHCIDVAAQDVDYLLYFSCRQLANGGGYTFRPDVRAPQSLGSKSTSTKTVHRPDVSWFWKDSAGEQWRVTKVAADVEVGCTWNPTRTQGFNIYSVERYARSVETLGRA